MNKEFFEKVFPTQGYVCIAGIDKTGKITPRFATDIDKALEIAQKFIDANINVYFTPGTYSGLRRTADTCVFVKAFFLDLDVMHGKNKYDSKEAALSDIDRFCTEINWPLPVVIDSGGGIHAYWILDQEIPGDEWKEYAKNFKQLCLDHKMIIDEGVPADAARLMRIPGTSNYRYDPPMPSSLLTDVQTHPFEKLVSALGSVQSKFDIKAVEKGLDDDTKAIYEARRSNFEYDFNTIAIKSLEGNGCGQIRKLLTEDGCEEPLWYAGISVATRCRDGSTAIHSMSEHDSRYDYDNTELKAQQSLSAAEWSHGCEAFERANRAGCDGCAYKGKISGPIKLGQILRTPEPEAEQTAEENAPRQSENKRVVFPDLLKPFSKGATSGVYFTPPPRSTKKGMVQDPDELLLPFATYPVQRLNSPHDGECLVMQVELPLEGTKEYFLPLKDVGSQEKLKTILLNNSVTFEPTQIGRVQSYLVKWSTYLTSTKRADIMRIQQGWTDNQESFVIGTNEYMADGQMRYCPPSPMSKNVVKHLHESGSYQIWREAAQMFNDPGYEWHAFTMLCGFGTALMELTNVNGVTLSLAGPPGCGKTGAMMGATSIWGKPDALAVYDGTQNALIQRMITLKNILFPLDEQSNADGKFMSHLIYNISSGQPKIRLKASTNEEREASFNTKQIGIITTNTPMKDIMGLFKANTNAENVRLLEPYIRMPNTAGYELTSERGKVMFDVFKTHYGFAGPIFVKELFRRGIPEIKSSVDKMYLRIGNEYTRNSEYRFIANLLAVTRKSGEIINDLGIVNFDLDRIFDVVGKDFIDIINGKAKDDLDNRSDVLGDFINKNIANILVIKDGKVSTEPRNALYIRAEVDENLIWVSSSAIKDYLRDIKLGPKEFEMRLEQSGLLKGRFKKQMAAGWRDAVGSHNVQAYKIEMDISYLFNEKETDGIATV